ncbi:MAG: DUF4054 domain-containing protein [Porphyromonas sp.]|nr:DUF4054 domain-containing protein [Porphyromonas sp.]
MINLLLSLRAQASGIKRPNSHTYEKAEFLAIYPQFKNPDVGAVVIPDVVLDMHIALANEVVSEERFGALWRHACGLYMAHMLTLWLQGAQPEGTAPAEIISAGSTVGSIASESADGVSYSLDTSAVQDLTGWADFKLTRYGVQYAALARRHSHGGMYIW